jgi:hypothetical protein
VAAKDEAIDVPIIQLSAIFMLVTFCRVVWLWVCPQEEICWSTIRPHPLAFSSDMSHPHATGKIGIVHAVIQACHTQ